MLGLNRDLDAAAKIEVGHDPAPARVERSNKIIEDHVGDVFVEDALVSELPQIEFE
jgi:hypothetical protein